MNRRKRNNIQQVASARGVGLRTEPLSATAPSRPLTMYGSESRQHSSPSSGEYRPAYHRLPTPEQDRPEPARLTLPEVRSLPTLSQPYSAPAALQPSPDAFAQRQYHTPQSSMDFRLAPLEWRSRGQSEKPIEHAAISPAATECSNQHAPSLISDNQSRCSVSPRTISSPRPGLPPPIQTSRSFYEQHRRQSYISIASDGKVYPHDEGYVSALPSSASVDAGQRRFPFEVALKSLYSPAVERRPDLQLPLPKLSPLAERDTRMNVSRLLD